MAAEQHHEFVSDSDFAFNLQIQEAIKASLSYSSTQLPRVDSREDEPASAPAMATASRLKTMRISCFPYMICQWFKALIEGMQAAVDLVLKKVTCFWEIIRKFVTEEQLLIESEIASLRLQLFSLRMNFKHFCLSLVFKASTNLKSSTKLTRDALVSFIIWLMEARNGRKWKETCAICSEDVFISQIFSVDGCLHGYCFSCMKRHAEAKLLNGMFPKCPHEGCESKITIKSCKLFLQPQLVDVMSQKIKEASVAATEKVYCPYLRCSALMSKKEVFKFTDDCLFLGDDPTGMRKCTKCFELFCINCMVPWHNDMNCSDFRKANPNPHPDDAKLKSLASKNKWRQCVKCNYMIELAQGCYHIYCRCGYQFCYTCGAEWMNKKATCRCPLWDECNIIRR